MDYDQLRKKSKALRTMDDDQLLTTLEREMANYDCNSVEYNALYHQTIMDEIGARIDRNYYDSDEESPKTKDEENVYDILDRMNQFC